LPADRIIKTGRPKFEVINSRKTDTEKSEHREENISLEVDFLDLVDNLNAVADKCKLLSLVSLHPRTRKMLESKGIEFNPLISLMKPIGFNDYVKLQT